MMWDEVRGGEMRVCKEEMEVTRGKVERGKRRMREGMEREWNN